MQDTWDRFLEAQLAWQKLHDPTFTQRQIWHLLPTFVTMVLECVSTVRCHINFERGYINPWSQHCQSQSQLSSCLIEKQLRAHVPARSAWISLRTNLFAPCLLPVSSRGRRSVLLHFVRFSKSHLYPKLSELKRTLACPFEVAIRSEHKNHHSFIERCKQSDLINANIEVMVKQVQFNWITQACTLNKLSKHATV